MKTIKEENEQRIKLAYALCKFGLKYKHETKNVTEVFSDVAGELGYARYAVVANIYYKGREEDPNPVERFKAVKNSKITADEN